MRIIGIYKIQSITKPNRIYIGSSVDINKRWKHHISQLKYNRHKNKKLQRHYNKYGISDLIFSIILECEQNRLVEFEQLYINFHNPYFNICKVAGITLGYKHSEKTKRKMRKPKTEEHKIKLSLAKKGIKTGRPPVNSGFKKGYIPWNKGKIKNKPVSKTK